MDKYLKNKLEKSIFISGMHRSGTSWVADIIATGGKYIIKDEEIFLPNYPSQNKPINIWYEYINSKNENKYIEYIENVLSNKYYIKNNLSFSKSVNERIRVYYLKAYSLIRKLFYESLPLILVEPLGLLSSEWFANTYKCKIVIIIRHPAAIISSLKINKIKYRFLNDNSLLTQNDFVKDHINLLIKDKKDIPGPNDIIGQGILMWKILYNYVLKLQNNNNNWIFVKHEDLSLDPIKEFKVIFNKLGLLFSNKTINKINILCSEDNKNYLLPDERDNNKRNSKELIYRWHEILTEEEIEAVAYYVFNSTNK